MSTEHTPGPLRSAGRCGMSILKLFARYAVFFVAGAFPAVYGHTVANGWEAWAFIVSVIVLVAVRDWGMRP